MKTKRVEAVSEIIGTMLLLAIAVMFFTVLYFQVLSAPTPTPPLIVNIAGMIEENCILLEHRGGETLSLDTVVSITIDDSTVDMTVGEYLDNESKEDGVWSLGERVVYPIKIDILDLNKNPQAEIVVIDRDTNSLVMMGIIDIEGVCDMGIEMTVDNSFPEIGANIVFTLTLTNHGNINVTGAEVKFILPEELTHYGNTTSHGIYKNSTGMWRDMGVLTPGQSTVLTVIATVEELGSGEPIQLAMILDGSSSISSHNWNLMKEGLKQAIRDESVFPHDGSVELTIIQFGGWNPHAQVELSPIIITDNVDDPGYYGDVSTDVYNIYQLGGYTPTGCGIRLGADQLHDVGNFSPDHLQAIVLVTDGEANCLWEPGGYTARYKGETLGKSSANDARDYLISTLEMTDDQDEFDAVAIGHSSPHAIWLKDNIAWPEPGYFAPPFQVSHHGWVNEISTWQEFADSIDDIFRIIFSQIPVSVQISSTTVTDPKLANNFVTVLLY